jgi:Arc/MetJ-type ribon-helix-helix transcriptional regulator
MNDKKSDSNDTTTEMRTDKTWHVCLPPHVGSKIEQRISRTNFDSVNEYVTFVLESLLRELDEQEDDDLEARTDRGVAADDTEAVRDQLESLGYL